MTTKVGTDRLDRSNARVLFSLAELLGVNVAGSIPSILWEVEGSGEWSMNMLTSGPDSARNKHT